MCNGLRLGFLATCLMILTHPSARGEEPKAERPLVAVWRYDEGLRFNSRVPYLRIAVWNDGRVVFAEDPENWKSKLREGQISAKAVADLKKRLLKSEAFVLKRVQYLVPDAPSDAILLDLDKDHRRLLHWDEVDAENYGIRTGPIEEQEEADAFIAAWKEINAAALAVRPEKSKSAGEKFAVPNSWFIDRPISRPRR